jgi:ABC-type branched-subunit amino acid transport system substrate-binding protein
MSPLRQKIAIFAPLYLDSAFEGSTYKFGKNFPKLLNPGLEFYQGAQMALDSLQKKSAPLEVYIYDSRSLRTPLVQRLNSPELRNVEMIIAHANSTDVKVLAEEARKRKIPFISATFPNDAGVTNNPYLVILNTTLRSHCEGIYNYIQKYHSRDNIILFRKNGAQENQIQDYLTEAGASTTSPLKINVVDLSKGMDVAMITSKLDSTRRNICIAGSLNEGFGLSLAQAINTVSEIYPATVMGMPTWEGIKQFSGNEFKNLEIVYSTPFGASRTTGLGSKIASQFEESINSRPTDMFFRGYETVLRFALLLLDTKKDVVSNLTRKGNYIFTPFDIQPVFLDKNSMTLDYFENKYLYFIKYNNGSRSLVKY